MKLWHGSQKIIEVPQFGLEKVHNDYGQGFYCTESLDLAKEWACSRDVDGFANRYELNYRPRRAKTRRMQGDPPIRLFPAILGGLGFGLYAMDELLGF